VELRGLQLDFGQLKVRHFRPVGYVLWLSFALTWRPVVVVVLPMRLMMASWLTSGRRANSGDGGKQAMLDLVPLARSRGK